MTAAIGATVLGASSSHRLVGLAGPGYGMPGGQQPSRRSWWDRFLDWLDDLGLLK